MRRVVAFIWIVACFCSCQPKQSAEQKDLLVKVNDRALSRADLKAALPSRLSSADSLIWAESFIKQWIKDKLVYDVALQNLTNADKQEIDHTTKGKEFRGFDFLPYTPEADEVK